MDEKAKDIIALRDRERSRQGNFRSLWQSVSDLMFPQTFGIASTRAPGSELMTHLFDTTGCEELENMTSGLVVNLFPPGQQFFAIVPVGVEGHREKRYVSMLTEAVHEAIFNSNFLAQESNTIQYWIAFGTGVNYSEFVPGTGLNFRDYAIGSYQCLENDRGIIDTIIFTCDKTARQLVQQFGINKVSRSVREAYELPEKRQEAFSLVHIVRPREDHDHDPRLRAADRMPFESAFVIEKDQQTVDEGGFDEFPFAVPRYEVVYGEVYGRGRGTKMLPQVRVLNRLARDHLEMSNKWVAPPLQVLESFDGQVDLTPKAQNIVTEINSIQPIAMGASGAYPITKDVLEYRRQGIRDGFYHNAFEPITPLEGDRRNTTEIIERLKEGMKRMSKPMGRLFGELVIPQVTRATMLLIRNGAVPPPPPTLQGRPFKIEIINPLALALRDQQARGLQYWVAAGQAMEQTFPGVTDNVEADVAFRDLGRSLGVKTEHIRPEDERDRIREQRAARKAALEQVQTGLAAAEQYSKSTKAPEEGSPAEVLIGA